MLVVEFGSTFVAEVILVGTVRNAKLELDERHDGIVDDADEFGCDALVHHGMSFGLQAADAVGLDVYLVGKAGGAQDAPCSAIVVHLLDEDFAADGHYLFEFWVVMAEGS